jgi:hypothetical protein
LGAFAGDTNTIAHNLSEKNCLSSILQSRKPEKSPHWLQKPNMSHIGPGHEWIRW